MLKVLQAAALKTAIVDELQEVEGVPDLQWPRPQGSLC